MPENDVGKIRLAHSKGCHECNHFNMGPCPTAKLLSAYDQMKERAERAEEEVRNQHANLPAHYIEACICTFCTKGEDG